MQLTYKVFIIEEDGCMEENIEALLTRSGYVINYASTGLDGAKVELLCSCERPEAVDGALESAERDIRHCRKSKARILTYKDIMPWEKIFDGVFVSSYGGVKVISVATWDYMVNVMSCQEMGHFLINPWDFTVGRGGKRILRTKHNEVFCCVKSLHDGWGQLPS